MMMNHQKPGIVGAGPNETSNGGRMMNHKVYFRELAHQTRLMIWTIAT
jgi:hypothetical protein